MEHGERARGCKYFNYLYYSWVDGLVCILPSSEPGNSSVQVLRREQSIECKSLEAREQLGTCYSDPKRKHGARTGNQEHPGSCWAGKRQADER